MSQQYPEIETGIREIALKKTQKKGFSDYVVSNEDQEKFWRNITTASCTSEHKTAETKIFQNDSDTDHTVPYMEKRTSVTTVDAEIQAEMQFEMVDNTKQAELKLQWGSFYTNEEKVEMQLHDVTLKFAQGMQLLYKIPCTRPKMISKYGR